MDVKVRMRMAAGMKRTCVLSMAGRFLSLFLTHVLLKFNQLDNNNLHKINSVKLKTRQLIIQSVRYHSAIIRRLEESI